MDLAMASRGNGRNDVQWIGKEWNGIHWNGKEWIRVVMRSYLDAH